MAGDGEGEAALEAERESVALNMPPNQPPPLLEEEAAGAEEVEARACLVAGPL